MPLFYNNGSPIEPTKFKELQGRLLDRFDGLTFSPQANQGFWRFGDITFRDFLSNLKEHLKQEFRQLDILIIEREVGLL